MVSSIRSLQQPGACVLVGLFLAFWLSDLMAGMNWLAVCLLTLWAWLGLDTGHPPHTRENPILHKFATVVLGGTSWHICDLFYNNFAPARNLKYL